MKARKNLLKILIFLILSGSIINAGYIKEKNTIYFTDETTEPERKEIVKNVDFRTFKIFEENDVEKINSKHHFFYYKLLKLQINAFFRYFSNFSIFPDNDCHNKHSYS